MIDWLIYSLIVSLIHSFIYFIHWHRRRQYCSTTLCGPVTVWCCSRWRQFVSLRSVSTVDATSCLFITRAAHFVFCVIRARPLRVACVSSSQTPASFHWRLNSMNMATTSTATKNHCQNKLLSKPTYDILVILDTSCTLKCWGVY